MGLPAPLKTGGVSAKLEKARAERSKAEATRRDLQDQLSALDVESDSYPTEVGLLSAQISVAEKLVNTLSLQVAGLESKLVAEEAAEKERRRVAAVAKVENLLPTYIKAVEDYAAALRPSCDAHQLGEARNTIAKQWAD
jgi:septal ring factor EnvC (AmiA/AmiB activator)